MNWADRILAATNVLLKGTIPNIYNVRGYQAQQGIYDAKGDKTKMLQSYVSWVYACVTIRAKSVASATFRAYKKGKSAEESIEIGAHPILDLFNEVNPISTRYDLFFLTVAHLDLTGDCYWYIPLSGLKIPGEIWTLPPDKVKIVPDTDGSIKRYDLKYGDRTIPFEPDEIVHFKYPNPSDFYYGASPLQAAAKSVDIDSFSHEYQRKHMANYAVPPLVLESDQRIMEPQIKQLKEHWNLAYGGDNVGKGPAVLDSGLKAKTIGMTMRDLQFVDSNNMTRDDILAVFNIPASKLGLVEDVNRANAEANDYTLAVNVIEPILMMMDERITQDLCRKYDERLIIKHDSTVPKDEEATARIAGQRVRSGLTTINEERQAEGYEPVEGGDDILIPAASIPLSRVNESVYLQKETVPPPPIEEGATT